ncbi:MAG: fimbrillin family protein [Bacteroidales bacterium]|nr:fimbrillin family protein [Bacteroidales bacterium]
MKKIFAFAIAAVAVLASCTKVENGTQSSREISFLAGSFVHTRANVAYANGNFGVYSWYNEADPFMVNEEVGEVESVWKTIHHTFYWPKTGTITFLSYSPFSGTNNSANSLPTVNGGNGSYSLAYGSTAAPYTVADDDLMYADVVTCECELPVTPNGVAETHPAVPTIFHHALAKVRFEACATMLEEGTAPDVTKWEITVKAARVENLYTTGTLSMNWERGEWGKPAGNVWTSPAGVLDREFANDVVLTESYQALGDLGFVLPQTLVDQVISLDVHIKTTLPNGHVIEEDVTMEAKLSDVSETIKSWQMNQSIVYRIKISPVDDLMPITFAPELVDWDEYVEEFTLPL